MSAMPSLPASGSTSWYTWATAVHRADDEVLRFFADVKHPDYGATGNGSTDDTAAINACIAASSGKTVVIPPGTYMINAVANSGAGGQPVGLMMNQPNVHLMLAPGATLQVITNASSNYSPIQVTAAGCTISGGKLIGDCQTHTQGGEFGYGIDVNVGGHKLTVRDMYIAEMWGDGILVMGEAEDTSIYNVTSWYNRRQGISVIDSVRTRVVGCNLSYTGQLGNTDPAAGIDLEPDPATTRDVIDCLVANCLFSHNVGPGFCSSSNGRELTATIVGCRSYSNGSSGTGWTSEYRIYGATNKSRFIGCHASTPHQGSGFWTLSDTDGLAFSGCVADNAPAWGFYIGGTNTKLVGCVATGNGSGGYSGGSTSGCL